MITIRNPRMGLLLIGSPRFKCLGEGTAHKTYEVRKTAEEQMILDNFREIGDVITPGIVYERQDVEKAVDLFFQEKVDCVAAVYLSWAEDFAWIRFLRDMPTVPIFLQASYGSVLIFQIRTMKMNLWNFCLLAVWWEFRKPLVISDVLTVPCARHLSVP